MWTFELLRLILSSVDLPTYGEAPQKMGLTPEVPTMAIKKRDISMIPYLRQDARTTLTDLCRKTGIPISTAYERLKSLRKAGVLKFTALLDFAQLGFTTRIVVAVKVDREARDEFEQYLLNHLQVNSVFRVNNGFSYLMDSVFKDMREAEDFIESMEANFKLRKKMVFYVIGDLKSEAFLSDPFTLELVDNSK